MANIFSTTEKDQVINDIRSRVDMVIDKTIDRKIEEAIERIIQKGASRVTEDIIIGLLRKGLEK